MLVLARKKDEIIDLEGLGFIQVIEIRGDKVRLGLDFPRDVIVHRREVTEAIAREAQEAEENMLLMEGNTSEATADADN